MTEEQQFQMVNEDSELVKKFVSGLVQTLVFKLAWSDSGIVEKPSQIKAHAIVSKHISLVDNDFRSFTVVGYEVKPGTNSNKWYAQISIIFA